MDANSRRVQELSDDFDHIVCADTTQPSTLKQLGVPEAKRVVIAIGSDLESSILTAAAVIDFGVGQVWAKADSMAHAKILSQIGCHHVIRPEADTGRRVAHLIGGGVKDYIEFDRDFAMAKMSVPTAAVGMTPRGVRQARKGVSIVAVRQLGGTFSSPTPDQELQVGDTIVAAGRVDDLETFAED